MKYDVYIKKLTPQELGYRRGRLMTGAYFYISKSAIGTFFEELDGKTHNDHRILEFNDPLEEGEIHATYVYHNDLYALEDGTRNEYRIYLNRDIAKHDLHFQPGEIVAIVKEDDSRLRIEHFKMRDPRYKIMSQCIEESKIRGNHALLSMDEFRKKLENSTDEL